jgi:RNA polymerase sigma factor (sigma-70 family)
MSPTLLQAVVRVADVRTPDGDLLERFARDRDERAFEELVRRHGPLVWAVCRQLLAHHADAEDAFQAVFLALVRGAETIREGRALPAWLHGVAVRVAMKVRRDAVRRRQREQKASVPEADRPVPDASWSALMTAVHEEIRQLPEAERTAFVLCDLEGVRQPDAAARLGWPPGTLSGRLCKARQRLLDQLTRRGIAPAVLALGGLAGSAGTVPAALLERVTSFPAAKAGVSTAVAELARGLVEGTAMRTKILAAGLLVAGALSMSGGALVLSQADAQGPGGKAGGPGKAAKSGGGGFTPGAGGEGGGGDPFQPGAPDGAQGRGPRGGPLAVLAGASAWEYKFVDIRNDRREFERTLTEQGKDGWEYAGSERDFPNQGRGELVLVFKKPRGGGTLFGGGGFGGSGFGGMPGFGGGGAGGGGVEMPPLPGLGGGVRFAGADVEARTHRLRTAKAADVAAAIEKAHPKAQTLKVVAEPRTNMLVIVADSATMRDAVKMVEKLDGGPGGAEGFDPTQPPRGGPGRPPVGGPGPGLGSPDGAGGRPGRGMGFPGGGPGPMGGGGLGPAGGGPVRSGPVHIVTLKHALAQELAPVVERVFPNAAVTAEPRSNQLIIRAEDRVLKEIDELIVRLDVEVRKR